MVEMGVKHSGGKGRWMMGVCRGEGDMGSRMEVEMECSVSAWMVKRKCAAKVRWWWTGAESREALIPMKK